MTIVEMLPPSVHEPTSGKPPPPQTRWNPTGTDTFDTLLEREASFSSSSAHPFRILVSHAPASWLPFKAGQVSFAYILGLFCLYTRSLLPLYQVSHAPASWLPFNAGQVSFASVVDLFCPYSRSLLPLQQVSHAPASWLPLKAGKVCMYVYTYIYMYICTCVCVCVYVYSICMSYIYVYM